MGRCEKLAWRVVTDLPDVLPVTEAELDLLEAALADFVAELLDGGDAAPHEANATLPGRKRRSGILPKGR